MNDLPLNQIIQGDCLEVLKTFPDKSVDLVVTSPPYDNLRSYKGFNFNFEETAKELYRIIKIGGVIVWVVGDQTIDGDETGTSFRQALYFKELGFNLHDTMIYEKNGSSFPDAVRYYQVFEYMFIFSLGMPKTINLIRDRKNNWTQSWGNTTQRQKNGELKIKGKRAISNDYGVRFNIWRINGGFGYSASDKIAYEHPAIFPEKLAADHIKSWSNECDLVLDPMCGSGTTCKMAQILGRNYIGIDIAPEYIEIAKKRLSQKNLL